MPGVRLDAHARFTHEDFARFHPAGSLGRKLLKIEAVMRKGNDLRISECGERSEKFSRTKKRLGRRTGAVMLTDDAGKLAGLFTTATRQTIRATQGRAFDRPIRE